MASYLIMALRFVMIAYWPNTVVLIVAQIMHAATLAHITALA